MRGVAACYVAIFHLLEVSIPGTYSIAYILGHGYIAVDLFFVLSGFVMALSYKQMFDKESSLRVMLVFLGRRLARLYPLYLFITVLCIVKIVLHLSNRFTVGELRYVLPANLLMVQTWFNIPSIEGPIWSISAEWSAYLIFPLLLAAVFGTRRSAIATGAVCAIALCLLAAFPQYADPTGSGWGGPLNLVHVPFAVLTRAFAEFTIGLLTYRLSLTAFGKRVSSNGSAVAAFIAIAFILVLLPWRYGDLLFLPFFALLILAICRDRGPVSRFLAWRPIYLLGVWSYSIYLVHPILQTLLVPATKKVLHHVMSPALAVPVSVAIAVPVLLASSAATYHYIEKPGRRAIQVAIANAGMLAKRKRSADAA